MPREAGVLLHPTCLPGGTLGDAAFRWIDWLAAVGFKVWQVLPLGPVGLGDSPYACPASAMGDPALIDLSSLVADGLLASRALHDRPEEPLASRAWHLRRLFEAVDAIDVLNDPRDDRELATLFMALRDAAKGQAWWRWPRPLRGCHGPAVASARRKLSEPQRRWRGVAQLFDRQWERVKMHAEARGVAILGDVPITVAHDSADVWAHQHLFALDADGRATAVAGVPPDAFSETGQVWNTPIYRWDRMADDGYAWWVNRLATACRTLDRVRIDHFRGLSAYYAIPAPAEDATEGSWQPGPGLAFFEALAAAGVDVSALIAEDLGLIDDDVHALRGAVQIPGMRVLQFAFDGDADNPHLPGNHPSDVVVYTGTHDNDTTAGWFAAQSATRQAEITTTLGCATDEVVPAMMEAAWGSAAALAIVPVQDLLALPSAARMNHPGRAFGNWRWRLDSQTFEALIASPGPDLARWSRRPDGS